MYFKVIVVFALIAVVAARPQNGGGAHHEEHHHHPKYEFKYGVEDKHTGDVHNQHELRDGEVTKGEYSLKEADGTVRHVKYVVDHKSGWNAIVERTGHAVHPKHGHSYINFILH